MLMTPGCVSLTLRVPLISWIIPPPAFLQLYYLPDKCLKDNSCPPIPYHGLHKHPVSFSLSFLCLVKQYLHLLSYSN